MKTQTSHSFIKGKFLTIVLLIVVIAHFILIQLGSLFQAHELFPLSDSGILKVDIISTTFSKPTLLRQAEIIKPHSNQTTRNSISNPNKAFNAKTDNNKNIANSMQPMQSNNATHNIANHNTQTPTSPTPISNAQTNLKSTEGVTNTNGQLATVNSASTSLNTANNSTQNANNTITPNPIKIDKPNAFAAHLHNPKPIYPKRSRELGEQGVVVLSIWVDIDGKPDKVQIIKSSGFPRLDDAAQRQISESWRFVPGQKNGQKEAMELIQRIPFTLNEATP